MEWCKILFHPNPNNFGRRILPLPNGDFIAMVYAWGSIYSERVWLFYFDSLGNLIWQKKFCQNDPKMMNEEAFDILLTQNGEILLSGICSYEDTLVPNLYWLAPLYVKSDMQGNEIYAKPWSQNHNTFDGWTLRSNQNDQGTIFSAAYQTNIPPNNIDLPAILKMSPDGTPLGQYNIINHPTSFGAVSTIYPLADSELLISYYYNYQNEPVKVVAAITDTLGNVRDEKLLIENDRPVNETIITSDNKFLMVGAHIFNNIYQTYVYKLTPDLEFSPYDSTYLNYDSLCPFPIPSDTIPLDCDIVTDIEEPWEHPELGHISIYPNPARDYLTISLPEFYTTTSQIPGMNIQTVFYTYPKDLLLEFTDMLGRTLYQQKVEDPKQEIEINVSDWPRGFLSLRLLGGGKKLTSGKVILY